MKRITLIAGLASAAAVVLGTLSAQADPYHMGRSGYQSNHFPAFAGANFHRPHFQEHRHGWHMWRPWRAWR